MYVNVHLPKSLILLLLVLINLLVRLATGKSYKKPPALQKKEKTFQYQQVDLVKPSYITLKDSGPPTTGHNLQ